ncbi:phosphate uptake regulator PhoU [Candidatus Bathyarchaeota archaeon]|nr:phosphate uptake regulator PhoU [Candidatus Bathyarchaeota archaeon]
MNSGERPGEVRRIQITGRGSYIVSLPKKWVKDRNLNRGEQVVFSTEYDGSLRIAPRTALSKAEPKEATIVVSADPDYEPLTRRIIALYLTGLNFIKLKTTRDRFEATTSEYVRDFVRKKLVGTEVVIESPSEIALQVLVSYPELSVENALRRMVIITLSMLRDAISALIQRNSSLADEVLRMDDEVDRFSFYVVRQLKTAAQDASIISQIGLGSGRDIIGYRLVTKSVERAADHAVKIAENTLLIKQPLPHRLLQRITSLGEFAAKVFEDAMLSLYRRSYTAAEDVLKRMDQLETSEHETIIEINRQKIEPSEMTALRMLLESIRRIGEYGSDVAEVVLNLTAVEMPKPRGSQ